MPTDTCITDVEWYRGEAERAGITRWSRPDLVSVRVDEDRHDLDQYRRAWSYFCQKGHRFTAPAQPTITDFHERVREWITLSGPAKLNGGWQ